MLLPLILVVSLGLSSVIATTPNNVNYRTARDVQTLEPRLVGAADATSTFEWLAVFWDKTTSSYVACGVIVNRYWIVGTQKLKALIPDVTKIHVYNNLLTTASIATATRRNLKEVKQHASYADPFINHLGFARVCPGFYGAYAPLAQPADTFPATTQTNLYTYDTTLKKGSKPIGATCQCEPLTGWDPTNMICLDEDAIHGLPIDVNGLVVTTSDNSKVIGFLIKEAAATGSGEIVIDIAKYYNYIQTQIPLE